MSAKNCVGRCVLGIIVTGVILMLQIFEMLA